VAVVKRPEPPEMTRFALMLSRTLFYAKVYRIDRSPYQDDHGTSMVLNGDALAKR
jgi:hypothetical protein